MIGGRFVRRIFGLAAKTGEAVAAVVRKSGQPEDRDRFDRATTCPKCGQGAAEVIYHPANVVCPQSFQDEHIHRTCTLCRFEWDEIPLDVAEAEGR